MQRTTGHAQQAAGRSFDGIGQICILVGVGATAFIETVAVLLFSIVGRFACTLASAAANPDAFSCSIVLIARCPARR
jgi:hypothetical protein